MYQFGLYFLYKKQLFTNYSYKCGIFTSLFFLYFDKNAKFKKLCCISENMKIKLYSTHYLKVLFILILSGLLLSGCNGKLGGDARKFPDDPKLRIKKNMEEGRGFRVNDAFKSPGGGVFEFASSNELWRASLDIIDFMPLTSVNYSGGIIISDWYSTDQSSNESIKISIRFLSNEIRADALDIKVFSKKCLTQTNCVISEKSGNITIELKQKILKTAAIYEKEKKDKKKK